MEGAGISKVEGAGVLDGRMRRPPRRGGGGPRKGGGPEGTRGGGMKGQKVSAM